MPYVPGLETDVFISYAHRNNANDWVTGLDKYLSARVPELLEHDANVTIWRDKSLSGFDQLWPTLQEKIAKSALFLSICSPVYVTSENCEKEVNYFLEHGIDTPRLERNSRMARVVIIPYTDTPNIRPCFRRDDTVRFSFFAPDDGGGTFAQYEIGTQPFKREAERLAQNIKTQLRRVREELEKTRALGELESGRRPPVIRKKIFIANCSKDRGSDRTTVINEFKGHDLLTVPDGDHSSHEVESQTREMLAQADCSVHILGETQGLTPDGGDEPIVLLQYRLALKNRAAGFTQIVWAPDTLQLTNARQKEFVKKVREFHADVWAEGTEVLGGARDDLLRGIAGVLERTDSTMRVDGTGPLYLLCDKADLESGDENLTKLRDCLCLAGILPEFPAFEGVNLDELEEDMIGQSCATVIYYGRGGDGWVKGKRQTLLRVLGQLREKKREAPSQHVRALYLSEPRNPFKQVQYLGLPLKELPEGKGYSPLLVLGAASGFQADHLKPLLERIAQEQTR